jgi:hypothetical protein
MVTEIGAVQKESEKIFPIDILSTTNPTCPDVSSNMDNSDINNTLSVCSTVFYAATQQLLRYAYA